MRPTAITIAQEKEPETLWTRFKRFGNRRASASALFKIALAGSIGVHAVMFAYKTEANASEERVVQIPVMLEAEEAQPPPPPPEEPPPPKPKPKPRPAALPDQIDKVVEGDGLRTGDLVDAEEGDYSDEPEPEPVAEPEPEEPPPPPPPPPEPKVDKVKLTRAFLARVRGALAARKTYPFSAERMGIPGAVSVSFVIEPSGAFSGISVARSSGHGVLDSAALQTVRNLSGQIRRPDAIGDVPLRTSVILRYSLDG
ncbi:MAG: energy transducer TonB [Myxococcota bacterium]